MSRTRPEDTRAVRIEAENEWAWCGARRLKLTPRAFAVLRHLVEHRERLITKEELLTTVWRDAVVSDAALASCIRDLRKALGDSSGAPRYIQTVHRRGFRFVGPVAGPACAADRWWPSRSSAGLPGAARAACPASGRPAPPPAHADSGRALPPAHGGAPPPHRGRSTSLAAARARSGHVA